MLSLTPDLHSERRVDPWLARLERQGLEAARTPILRALSGQQPQRILHAGVPRVDYLGLETAFPEATIRDGAMPLTSAVPAWSGWPDLVVCAHSLSARQVDPAACLAAVWRGLAPGGRIVVVDLYDAEPARAHYLERQSGRVCDPRLLEALCAAFSPIRADIIDHPDGIRSLVFVGRRPQVTID